MEIRKQRFFELLNNYHSNVKLIIEVNPSNFLDGKLTNINGAYNFNVYRKNYLHHTPPKLENTNKRKVYPSDKGNVYKG